jgi:hypothetical protein
MTATVKTPTTAHNHIKQAVAFLALKNMPPQLHLLTIAHDDWCDFISGTGFCNCEPEFKLKRMPTTEDNKQ